MFLLSTFKFGNILSAPQCFIFLISHRHNCVFSYFSESIEDTGEKGKCFIKLFKLKQNFNFRRLQLLSTEESFGPEAVLQPSVCGETAHIKTLQSASDGSVSSGFLFYCFSYIFKDKHIFRV